MNKKVEIKRIANFIKPQWPYLIISFLMSLFFVFFNSLSIWLTATLVNNVVTDYNNLVQNQNLLLNNPDPTINDRIKVFINDFILRDTNLATLKVLCIIIITVFILKNIFLYLKNISMSFVQLKTVTNLRNLLYGHIQSLSLPFFQRRKFGDLSSVIIHDVGLLNKAIGTTFHKIIVEPLNIIVFTILLLIISWKLTLVAILIIPVSQLVIKKIGESIRRKARRNTKQIGGILSIITETFSSIRIVKAFAMEEREVNRFEKESWKYFKLLFRSERLKHFSSPIVESLGISLAVLLLWLGGSQALTGDSMTSEDFLRFMFLMFSMLGPIRSLSTVQITLQNGMASAERIFEVLDEVPEIQDAPDAIECESFSNSIIFNNVSFEYQNGSFLLKNINFALKKGKTIALVGPSGAGKSTIADLIPRFFDVSSGQIMIDNRDIRTIQKRSLRRLMGIVTQETILLNDTIRTNIIYSNQQVDEEMLIAASEAANAIEFIHELPEQFDTIIGERGVKLSGGQRQRIAIARALYKNPPILILDEATSALDTQSERLVQSALENLMKNRTVLVIAHRLSTVINADKIIVLNEGQIVGMGTHSELLESGGLYKELYAIQFAD